MKHVFILFFSLSLILVSACNNDDDGNTSNSLSGTWELTNVHGGLIPINLDYNEGDVTWIFNRSNGRLDIQNNIETTGPEQLYSGLPTGSYNYQISSENNQEVLFIQNERKGVLLVTDTSFQIDNGLASDGLLTTFDR